MGGKKRTIEIKKIENKSWKDVAFSKRRRGLFSKASQLCLLSDAKIAILATPLSSQSHASFYSFGHSSVDNVVSAFLTNLPPRGDNIKEPQKELGFWWEDERFANSEDPKELSDAMDSVSAMLQNLKGLQSEVVENRRKRKDELKKKKKMKEELEQNQTLNTQSTCGASTSIPDGSHESFEGLMMKSEEKDQIIAISDNKNMNKDIVLYETHQELDQNQTLNLQSCSASIGIHDGSSTSFEGLIKKSEKEGQTVAISNENNNGLLGNLDGCNKELSLDEIFGFETNNPEGISMDDVWSNIDFDEDNQPLSGLDENPNITSSVNNNALHGDLDVSNQEADEYFDYLMNCEDLSMNLKMDDMSTNQNMCLDYEAIEDGVAMMIHKESDEDDLHFSDYFSVTNFEDIVSFD